MEQKESKSKKHFTISLIKSVVRIGAYIMLALGHLYVAGVTLIVAEALGIAEEL